MRRRVDAARQAADDDEAARREIRGQPLGHRRDRTATPRASRRSRPRAARAPRAIRASRAPAADRRSSSARRGIRGSFQAIGVDPAVVRAPIDGRGARDAASRPVMRIVRPVRAPAVGRARRRERRLRAAARRSAATTRTAAARARRSRRRSVMAAPHQARARPAETKAGAAAPKRAGPDLTSSIIARRSRTVDDRRFVNRCQSIARKMAQFRVSAVAYGLLFARR